MEDFSDVSFKSFSNIKEELTVKKCLSENPNDQIFLKTLDQENQYEQTHQQAEAEIADSDEEPHINQTNDIEIPLDRIRSSVTDIDASKKNEPKRKKKYKKTLFLSSDDLKKLNLNYGKNDVTFTVDGGFQGVQTI